MVRMFLAAAAAFALVSASPAVACPDCHDCPMHKDKAAAAAKAAEPDCPMHKAQLAAAEKEGKKDGEKKVVACPCAGEGKDCKCGAQCGCPHCTAKKAEKKPEAGKKS
jgi:hypothetical protein